jgi:hypothetical protein
MKKLIFALLCINFALPLVTLAACVPGDYRCEMREGMGGQNVNGDQFYRNDEQQAHIDKVKAQSTAPKPTKSSSQTTSAPPDPSDVDELPTDSIQADADKAGYELLDQAANVVGCQTGGKGGALASNFAQSLSQAAGSFIRGKAGKFLDKLPGPLRNLAEKFLDKGIDKLSGLVGKAIDDLGIGKALDGLLGGNASSLISGLLGGDVSGVAQQALGGLLGGALGPISGVLGGGLIPVDPKTIVPQTNKINAQTLATQNATELAVQVTCVGNVATKQAAKAAKAQLDQKALENFTGGNNGKPYFTENYVTDFANIQQEVMNDFLENDINDICTPYKEIVKPVVLNQFQYDHNLGKRTQCGAPNDGAESEGGEKYTNWVMGSWDPSASKIGATMTKLDELDTKLGVYTQAKMAQLQAVNGRDVVKCADGSEAVAGSYCKNGESTITTPYKFVEEPALKAILAPQEDLGEADAIGELINATAASLQSVLFEGINGLIGLSESSGSEGSYLDEMVTESGGQAHTAVQGAVASDLESAISIETEYGNTVLAVMNSLGTARATYSEVAACYKLKSTTVSGDTQALVAKMNNASSTITTLLTPELNRLESLLSDSDDALDQLYVLESQVETALTRADLVAVNQELTALTQSGLLHTLTDLNLLQVDLAASADTLDLLTIDAVAQLSECRAL